MLQEIKLFALTFYLRLAKSWTLFKTLEVIDIITNVHKTLRSEDKDRVVTLETLTEASAPKVAELLGMDANKSALVVHLIWDLFNLLKPMKPAK